MSVTVYGCMYASHSNSLMYVCYVQIKVNQALVVKTKIKGCKTKRRINLLTIEQRWPDGQEACW